MTRSLYYHAGTDRTFEADDTFAAKFVGLTKVEEPVVVPKPTIKATAKNTSSKEGTK